MVGLRAIFAGAVVLLTGPAVRGDEGDAVRAQMRAAAEEKAEVQPAFVPPGLDGRAAAAAGAARPDVPHSGVSPGSRAAHRAVVEAALHAEVVPPGAAVAARAAGRSAVDHNRAAQADAAGAAAAARAGAVRRNAMAPGMGHGLPGGRR